MPDTKNPYTQAVFDLLQILTARYGGAMSYIGAEYQRDEWMQEQTAIRLKALVADVLLASLRLSSPEG